ncbi:PD-(D/E)XK nuclease family protein [Lewinella sp. IMCC34183]|uniref:PDDEXK-like family protein n=1 Tax=Lewinella sp. IMCC34183 TaxID=2248762 RepID=UPI000E24715A|nr:PD-(D/E)XK nuclease family protein [Lewinella sp. IMCC34183]
MTTNSTFDRSSVNQLLSQVARIKANNDRITKLKKESFNIFSLLRKEHDEEYLHSAFIMDLLNPLGTHGMGRVFAELFFEVARIEFPITDQTSVEAEKRLPRGRADIFLETGERQAIIENKIHAGDQENQLERYSQFLHARDAEGSVLIYLTLDGRDSKDGAKKSKSLHGAIEYHRVSYGDDLLTWLQRCREKAVDHAPLRETIKQYVVLVRKLTGQLTNDEMIEELKTAIQNNYIAADLVSKQIEAVRVEAVTNFIAELTDRLTAELDEGWSINPENKSFSDMATNSWTSLVITHKKWPSVARVEIQGQATCVNDRTVYGIVTHKDEPIRSTVDMRLGEIKFFHQNMKGIKWWPWQDNLFNFGDPEEMAKLFDETLRTKLIKNVVEKVISLCKASQQPLSTIGP